MPPGASNAEFAFVFVVSENCFRVLGVAAKRGRTFDSMPNSELAASPPVLISENYWQKRFARDPAVVGKTVRLNGAVVTIAGITPRDFVGTRMAVPDFWVPAAPIDARWCMPGATGLEATAKTSSAVCLAAWLPA